MAVRRGSFSRASLPEDYLNQVQRDFLSLGLRKDLSTPSDFSSLRGEKLILIQLQSDASQRAFQLR